MGHGAAWAVGLVYGILIATKYVIARWAVVPIADGGTAWISGNGCGGDVALDGAMA